MTPTRCAVYVRLEPTSTVARLTRPVMWFSAQPVDGGRMEIEVAFWLFLDATSIFG
jgi:hypothetical protein